MIRRPALFLDRDGVVIQERGYIREAALVELVPGIAHVMRQARSHGFYVILVTNQSGIGRGWVTPAEYLAVSERMLELLRGEDAFFDHLFYAPFYMNSPVEKKLATADYASLHAVNEGPSLDNHGHWQESWRKPDVGMVARACELYDLNLSASLMIGDRLSDLELAGRAGMKKAYLFKSQEFLDQIPSDQVGERKAKWESLHAKFPATQMTLISSLAQIDLRDWQ